ncbi:MAG TPA: BTAD domain-containing putative transcriptional regulator, partial [Symbiobacteriaceae bacterium]|nr:BTAD domain-containing putative transcriptional regulator [Symbiobacteriaceae bacterium]
MLPRISCSGPFRVSGPDEQPLSFPTRSTEMLLAFLALHPGRRFKRAELIRRLWPDRVPDNSAGYLRVTLSRLRSALYPADRCICTERDEVWLSPAEAWIDLAAFRQSREVDLVSGPLLEGWEYEWLQEARHALHVEVLSHLVARATAALQAGAVQPAIASARQLLSLDPTHEMAYQILMRAHIAMGEPETALSLFRQCRAVLEAELCTCPTKETERLAAEAGRMAAANVYQGRPSLLVGRGEERRI